MNKTIMKLAGFDKSLNRIEAGLCPICGMKINMDMFVDALSIKEFCISGMCQACQDDIFKKEDM